jgi:predicted nucleotidyltransferase component of viral defense system
LDTIITPMQIDITTGDAITPREILYNFKKIFEESTIDIWVYNIESVLAEKYETILRHGEFNTRSRDFYDVYILTRTQEFDRKIFGEAVLKTAEHRGTIHIFDSIEKRIAIINDSKDLQNLWNKYRKNYSYAKGISYGEVSSTLNELLEWVK